MSSTSTAELFVRLALSFAVVLGLMVVASRVFTRGRGPARLARAGRRSGNPIEVVAHRSLGRRSSIVVVRAGGKGLVLGVTDAAVQVLAEAEPEVVLPPLPQPSTSGTTPTGGPPPATRTWKAVVDDLRERTVRRT